MQVEISEFKSVVHNLTNQRVVEQRAYIPSMKKIIRDMMDPSKVMM